MTLDPERMQSLVRLVAKSPRANYPAVIFDDDGGVIIWVDWRADSAEIVADVSATIGDDQLVGEYDEDAPVKPLFVVKRGDERLEVVDVPGASFQHQTLLALQTLISSTFQIRFVSDTNGADTLGFVVAPAATWARLRVELGKNVDSNFVPIADLPDLFETPGNLIDEACDRYAHRSK